LVKHVDVIVESSEFAPIFLNYLNDPNKNIRSAHSQKKKFVISASRFQKCSVNLKYFRGFGHLIF